MWRRFITRGGNETIDVYFSELYATWTVRDMSGRRIQTDIQDWSNR